MDADSKRIFEAIDKLEDALAGYFAQRDIPMQIQRAVAEVEIALIDPGMSPLAKSGLEQRRPDPE